MRWGSAYQPGMWKHCFDIANPWDILHRDHFHRCTPHWSEQIWLVDSEKKFWITLNFRNFFEKLTTAFWDALKTKFIRHLSRESEFISWGKLGDSKKASWSAWRRMLSSMPQIYFPSKVLLNPRRSRSRVLKRNKFMRIWCVLSKIRFSHQVLQILYYENRSVLKSANSLLQCANFVKRNRIQRIPWDCLFYGSD